MFQLFRKKDKKLSTVKGASSRNYIERCITNYVREYFFHHKCSQFMLTAGVLFKQVFTTDYNASVVQTIINTRLPVEKYHLLDGLVNDADGNAVKTYPPVSFTYFPLVKNVEGLQWAPTPVSDFGHPYVFHMDKFLTPAECAKMFSAIEDSSI